MRAMTMILSLFVLGVTATRGEAKNFGTWTVQNDSADIVYASTVNDSGREFGQACDINEGSCFWFLGVNIKCTENHSHPVLVTSDAGVVALEVRCYGQHGTSDYTFTFTDFDRVNTLVRQSKQVGIAIAMDDGDFIVVRFDLRGAVDAISAMREAATKQSKRTLRNTRDKRL